MNMQNNSKQPPQFPNQMRVTHGTTTLSVFQKYSTIKIPHTHTHMFETGAMMASQRTVH